MKNVKNKLAFAAASAFLFCAVFLFAGEVCANGNISADTPSAPPPPIKTSVRRAPVRRPPQQAPAAASKPAAQNAQSSQTTQVQKPGTSLETGMRLAEQGRYKQAHPWLQKAVQEERGNPYAWYWYGVVHDKVGQYEQAQFFYAKALALDPAFPPFSRVLAYPDDGDRKALWDPLRPARVYPIELGNQDVAIVPPGSPNATPRQTAPYVDPAMPKVPVYVPPELPAAVPGDAVQPPVYVPPNFSTGVYAPEDPQLMQFDSFDYGPGDGPVYVPPPPPR